MSSIVQRGYVSTDTKEFNEENIKLLKTIKKDICYLINNNYGFEQSITFTANHYLLSSRQRIALKRAICNNNDLIIRKEKQIYNIPENCVVNIDGLNIIITLEVALSNSTIIKCMDNTIRDLAGLRGTYKIIDKTYTAIELILNKLNNLKIKCVNFYLDSPVSNTGKLKELIYSYSQKYIFEINVELVANADVILENMEYVVTSDGIILNKCVSFINLCKMIIDENIKNTNIIDLS